MNNHQQLLITALNAMTEACKKEDPDTPEHEFTSYMAAREIERLASNLKPCPFCGGEAAYTVLNNSAYIRCNGCRARGGYLAFNLKQDIGDKDWKARIRGLVTDKWNGRV